MSSEPPDFFDDLRGIDEACDDFEQQFRSGKGPQIEDFLSRVPLRLQDKLCDELEQLLTELKSQTFNQVQADATLRSNTVVLALDADGVAPDLDSAAMPQLDRYQVLKRLGAGGMGTVFLAEQLIPVQRLVALKIIKKGMDSEQVISRFELERQALAMMDHPNIARVFDAGIVADGRPFFAMEYVDGIPLTEHCDSHELGLKGRLELFLQVCNAVQHAHQKGVIHRDLKPSNILVAVYDDRPSVKVIDFGLAKAVQGSLANLTVFTGLGEVLGTLAYMSPEQAEGGKLDIDTRTDVYSLGVVLYELLTGSTPLNKERLRREGTDLVLRLIREEEATRPSLRLFESNDSVAITKRRSTDPRQLSSILRGDLDWIAMKALEKNRNRRYETISALGNDIQRFLRQEPIEARPPSFGYRFGKAAKKYRRAFITGFTMLALLILGLVGTITGWVEANRFAQVSELRRVFDTRLLQESRPLGSLSLQHTRELLQISDQMSRVDARQASESQVRALRAMLDSLTAQVSAQRLSETDLALLASELTEFGEVNKDLGNSLDPERLAEVERLLQSRRRDWRAELATSIPPSPSDLAYVADQGVVISGTDFELPVNGRQVPLSLSATQSPRNVQVTADFVRGLDSSNWLGLSLSGPNHEISYRFILSTAPLLEDNSADVPRLAPRGDIPPESDNLLAFFIEERPVILSISRSGQVLAQRSVRLSGPTVRLSARREQELLTLVADGNQVLTFDDAFPLPHRSVPRPGILWPQDVAVSKISVDSQSLESESSSPLERADTLFAEEDYLSAEQAYAQLDSLEANYKRAVCLRRLNRPGAKPLFEQLATEAPPLDDNGQPASRWHLLAVLQLLDMTSASDPVVFQQASDQVTGLYRDQIEYILRVVPQQLQSTLMSFLQKDGARWRIAIRSHGDVGELELAIAVQQAGVAPPVRLRATQWRLADAKRLSGNTTQAIAILDELIAGSAAERESSREYAALVSDRCWLDFTQGRVVDAETRLRGVLAEYADRELPISLSYLLVDLARAQMIQDANQAAALTMERYFAIADPARISHGEFVDACLVGGLAQARLGLAENALQVWQRGLRRNWTGGLTELATRRNAFGLALVDAQKSIDGEAILEPLAGEKSATEITRGIRLDLEESGLSSDFLMGPTAQFILRGVVRDVVDNLFNYPGGSETREQIILHQLSMQEQFRVTLTSIVFEGVRSFAFRDEVLSEEFVTAARDVCEELIEHYDDERLDPKQHFLIIFQACMGLMSNDSWGELQRVVSPRLAAGIALVQAKQNITLNSEKAIRFLDFVIESETASQVFKSWAQAERQQLENSPESQE